MHHFLFKTVLFLFPILAGVVFCELLHRSPDNDYKYKYHWLSEHASSVEVLALGSSHSYFGIDPIQFDYLTFNAAHVSQDFHYDKFIFDSFFERMESLKFVILPISYFSPWGRLEDSIENWRVKYYSIYYHCPFHRWEPQYNLEISSGLRPKAAFRELVGKGDNRICSEYGQGTTYRLAMRSVAWKESGVSAAERHTISNLDSELYFANFEYVASIIEKCDRKHVRVILVTTPGYLSYREHLDNNQLALTYGFIRDLLEKHNNVLFVDLLSDSRFIEDDFYDADHLNEYGAVKFSSILNQFVLNGKNDG